MSEENNNNVTEIQVAQEEPKLKEEPQFAKQERKEKLRKYILFAVVLAVVMSVLSIASFNVGKKSVREEANAKVAQLEQQLRKEYADKKYALLETQYEIFELLKEGRTEYCIEKISWDNGSVELGDDGLDKLALGNLLYISDRTIGVTDDKVLEYVETLKKMADKYPYSVNINHNIVYRLETVETECREKIKKSKSFEAMSDLKAQCKENIALWKIE